MKQKETRYIFTTKTAVNALSRLYQKKIIPEGMFSEFKNTLESPENYKTIKNFYEACGSEKKYIDNLSELFIKFDKYVDGIEKEKQPFYKLKQGNATNGLAKTLSKKITDPAQLDFLGNGVIENVDKKGNPDFRLFIKGYTELTSGIKTSAVKLLDCFIVKLSEEGIKNEVKIPLKEYMEMRDLTDYKEARSQVNKDMEALERIKFEFRENNRGKGGNWLDVSLFGGTKGITNGIIHFTFNNDFIKCIPEKQYMYLPKEALTFKDKYNPHSYHMVRQIALHKRMNAGKPHEDIITVETLLNAIPSLPTYKTVMEEKHKQVDFYIIKPFERDLDAVKSFSWEYIGEAPTNYNEFIKSSIKIIWGEYPDIQKLKNEKKQHRQKTAQQKTIKKKISELEQKVSALQGV